MLMYSSTVGRGPRAFLTLFALSGLRADTFKTEARPLSDPR